MMLYIQKIYGNERRKEMKVWEVKRQYVTDDACEAGGELRLYDNYEDAHQFYAAVEQDELTYANENNLEIDFDVQNQKLRRTICNCPSSPHGASKPTLAYTST